MNNEEISTKLFFIKYGICTGFLVLFLFVVIYTVRIAHNAWADNLKISVENCLDDYGFGVWEIGAFVDIKNPYTTSAACYEARNKETGEECYSVITRVMTFYGPVNYVFFCSKTGEISLVGVSSLHGRIMNHIDGFKDSKRLDYYLERIPMIIGLEVETEEMEAEND